MREFVRWNAAACGGTDYRYTYKWIEQEAFALFYHKHGKVDLPIYLIDNMPLVEFCKWAMKAKRYELVPGWGGGVCYFHLRNANKKKEKENA